MIHIIGVLSTGDGMMQCCVKPSTFVLSAPGMGSVQQQHTPITSSRAKSFQNCNMK